jgi:hypothetical protein
MATHTQVLDFDPDMVARLEASGWKAYYAHDWLRAFLLLVRMDQEQFHIPFPRSLLGAYYTVRASIAFAPADHDAALPAVRDYLRKFYALVAEVNGQQYDPDRVGDLELDYWIVHRQVAVARATDYTPLVDSLAALHAAIFDSTPEQMRASAESRARSAAHVDLITSKRSTDEAADWRAVYFYLRRSYEQARAEL